MPLVSIIVPVYNCAGYLRDCIDSLLAQTLSDIELLLIDDGSTDGCADIIDEYARRDLRVKALHQENKGQSAARNAGLEAASGVYVYISDSDDIIDPGMLETVIPRFSEGYEMVAFSFETYPPEEGPDRGKYRSLKTEKVFEFHSQKERFDFLTGDFRMKAIRWEVWNRVFRRDIIERCGIRFPSDRRAYPEDMYFCMCYTAHISRILLIPDVLYRYIKRPGSVSNVLEKDLMILTSNLLARELCRYYAQWPDCSYLSENSGCIYYLMHKGALRRLRRYQWENGLSITDAREILRENVDDYDSFISIMTSLFDSAAVRKSYMKDRGRLLQFTDRIYTGQLLEIPGSGIVCSLRKTVLEALRLLSKENRRYRSAK